MAELGDAAKAAAAHGYLVLNISYDLSAPRWPRQLQQVGAAIDYVRSQGTAQGIDPARVGLLGDSAGAGLVLEAGLLGDHHAVQAVVSWSGPTDFTSLSAQATPGDTYQQAAAVVDPSLALGCPLSLCPCLLPRLNEVFRLSHGVLFSLRAASIWRRPVAAAVAGCPAVAVPDPGQLAARVVVR